MEETKLHEEAKQVVTGHIPPGIETCNRGKKADRKKKTREEKREISK